MENEEQGSKGKARDRLLEVGAVSPFSILHFLFLTLGAFVSSWQKHPEKYGPIVFAGGGTGGHLYPALAIIEWFRDHHPDVRFEFLCTERPIDAQILSKWNVPFTTQPVQPLGLRPRIAIRFLRAWRQSMKLCNDRFNRESPAVVVGAGGFGSGPAVKAALKQGIPTALLNPDAIPGRANRYLGRKVSAIYAQWDSTAACFPASATVIATGCPVRKEFRDPGSGTEHALFGLDPALKTLLITGASSGARTINEAVMELASDVAQIDGWQLLHISGELDAKRLEEVYESAQVRASVVPFTHEMAAALRIADLVLARAGAVTLAELAATATPAVLMPYPFHKDDHQTANAEMLVRQGSAIRVADLKSATANADQLRTELLPLMRRSDLLAGMAAKAKQSDAGNAARTISEHLLKLAARAAE